MYIYSTYIVLDIICSLTNVLLLAGANEITLFDGYDIMQFRAYIIESNGAQAHEFWYEWTLKSFDTNIISSDILKF